MWLQGEEDELEPRDSDALGPPGSTLLCEEPVPLVQLVQPVLQQKQT